MRIIRICGILLAFVVYCWLIAQTTCMKAVFGASNVEMAVMGSGPLIKYLSPFYGHICLSGMTSGQTTKLLPVPQTCILVEIEEMSLNK